MRVLLATAMLVLLTGPTVAQTQAPVQRYGEPDKDKTPGEIESEKRAEAAYKRSLGNVPNAATADPWGGVRGGTTPKPIVKPAAVKHAAPASAPR
jgi:hypothetical protein